MRRVERRLFYNQLKSMKFDITLDDLSEEMKERIRYVLRYDLAEEIDEAAEMANMDRETAEAEVVDNYLNTHNFSQPIEL